MAGVVGSRRVTYIVLRVMRKPILVVIAVYAISMLGWVLIPGPVIDGVPQSMSFFHAFYFLTYTATTTGFGEIPYEFSDGQRVWAMVCLYVGVIAWLYAISGIIHLFQNPYFRQTIAERRFAKSVARLNQPFVIVCGFGNRGSLLTRGLSDAGINAVILDISPDRINAVYLRDYRIIALALCADARIPERLIDAGVTLPNCQAIVALTSDEEVNVKIAVSARLLNPGIRVVIQSTRQADEETLSTLGRDVYMIDPFQTFARYLAATIHNPLIHMLNEWMIGAPGATLAMYPEVPRGCWIICGFGRMGRTLHEAVTALGMDAVMIDPTVEKASAAMKHVVAGRASQQNLCAAGIEYAAGIVAGTNSDTDNLSIVMNAKSLNPGTFIIVRQNQHRNELLFNAARADLIMQPTLVSARRILFLLIAPLLSRFFAHARSGETVSEKAFLRDVILELHDCIGEAKPQLWTTTITAAEASALTSALKQGKTVRLGDIVRDPAAREQRLAAVPLVIRWQDEVTAMPPADRVLRENDEILFCGTDRGRHLLDATLNNAYTLNYLVSGVDEPRGYVMQWLMRRSRFVRAQA
jgi:Trk K+ transport system NAD-binding subunit